MKDILAKDPETRGPSAVHPDSTGADLVRAVNSGIISYTSAFQGLENPPTGVFRRSFWVFASQTRVRFVERKREAATGVKITTSAIGGA